MNAQSSDEDSYESAKDFSDNEYTGSDYVESCDEDGIHLSDEDILKFEIKACLGKSIMKTSINEIKVKIYYVSIKRNIKKILKNVDDYTFNNNLNSKHLESLQKNFSDKSILINNFTCFKTKNDDTYHLLDGHHRRKIILDNDIEKCPDLVIFTVYYFDSTDDPKIEELFDEINNTKPYNKDIVKIARRITKRVKKCFETHPNKKIPNKIFSDSDKRMYRWKINTINFNDQLQIELSKMNSPIDEEKIFKKILEIDSNFKSNLTQLVRNKISSNENLNERKRYIKDLNCYLVLKNPHEYLFQIRQ